MADNSPATTAGEDALQAISKEEADIEADDASSAQRMHDGTPSSVESTPEPTGTEPPTTQDAPPPQKRKGGRKPIYATSEERKQRNRQAQAAFRERRTEYIKQLEETIKQNEDTLRSLQQSHRSAADECLMLRYKNSLLERILLEKGIDVQAELSLKSGPAIGHPQVQPQVQAQMPPAVQRTAMNRQFARRSFPGVPQAQRPMSSPSAQMLNRHDGQYSASSPQGQPTPSSHASSPNAMSVRSPGAGPQNVMTPPASMRMAPGQAQHFNRSVQPQPSHRSHYMMQNPAQRSASTQYGGPSASGDVPPPAGMMQGQGAAAYPSPFSKQVDGLDQEYDASQNQVIEADQSSIDSRTYRGSDVQSHEYQEQYTQPQQYHQPGVPMTAPTVAPPDPKARLRDRAAPQMDQNGQYQPMNIDNFDPMFDADPFGLSASMHFPTSYSFDQQPR
ncbi:hypothetical protein MBLNU457_3434t2 [Dothideomycetes sp. NU457]